MKWQSVSSNAAGDRVAAAVASYGYIYTSTNYGQGWVQQDNSQIRRWYAVSSSASGMELAAGAVGYMFTSSDGGVSWVERRGGGDRNWRNVAMRYVCFNKTIVL